MKSIKRVYSKLTYYMPFLIKPIEDIYYVYNNIKTNKKEYNIKYNKGKELFENITKDDNYYYIFIDKGIGDTLIVASYSYYLKQKYNKKIAFVVLKNHASIIKLYDYIDNTITCTKEEYKCIELYITNLRKYETDKYKYAYFEMKISKNGIRNWSSAKWNKKIVLSERYKKYVFNLSNECDMILPSIKNNDDRIQELLLKYNIMPNSILIIPYANTAVNFKSSFWENLTNLLIDNGYKVYTNIGNPKIEFPIEKTIGLNLSLEELFLISNSFVNIISIRCGLAEYLGLNNPNMVVINDHSKNYDGWDDINVYSSKKTITNLYRNKLSDKKIIDKIIDIVGGKK